MSGLSLRTAPAAGTGHFPRLKALHLHGMATAWRDPQAEAPRSKAFSIEALALRLPDARQADRQTRSLRCQLKAARFPVRRDLTGFDWSQTPLDAGHVHELAKGRYPGTARNLILAGRTGAGKTHPAIAPGVAAIRHGKRMRICNAADLVNQLEREKAQGRAGSLARQLTRIGAAILGEPDYPPFPASGVALPFRLIRQLYEKTSLIITPNFGFAEWVTVFGDAKMTAALLGRITRHCGIPETANDSWRSN